MYVDKPLSGIKAVQTLSRLNRAHPQKHDVLRARLPERHRDDPDGLRRLLPHDDPQRGDRPEQAARPEGRRWTATQVYSPEQVDELVELFLGGRRPRQARPDPRRLRGGLRGRARRGRPGRLQGQGQGVRAAPTTSSPSILPYSNAEWEKLSIFLNFLIPKLPAPKEEDLAKGILEAIDMDSYRVEKKAAMKIALADEDAEIEPVPTSGGGRKPEPELDRLSNILKTFNDQFGNIDWTDADRMRQAHHRGHPGEGRRRRGLPERQEEHRQAERPHRARQGAGAGDDRRCSRTTPSSSSSSSTTSRSSGG